jgi:hypothetical protein
MAEAGIKPVDQPLWRLWRSYCKLFPTATIVFTALTTPGAWSWLGSDVVTGLRRNASTQKAHDLLAAIPQAQFDAVSILAESNMKRQEQGFQVLVLFYITVPVTLLLGMGDIAPDILLTLFRKYSQMMVYTTIGFVAASLTYLASLWRSRQMVHVLNLIRAERGVASAD